MGEGQQMADNPARDFNDLKVYATEGEVAMHFQTTPGNNITLHLDKSAVDRLLEKLQWARKTAWPL